MEHLNYSREIERSIDYIEEHLRENLTAEEIAAQAGYSLYHFCRMFSRCREMPVMEYVRSRRLSLAAVELFGGRRITDIALEYGFETPAASPKPFARPSAIVPRSMRHGWTGISGTDRYTKSGIISGSP